MSGRVLWREEDEGRRLAGMVWFSVHRERERREEVGRYHRVKLKGEM